MKLIRLLIIIFSFYIMACHSNSQEKPDAEQKTTAEAKEPGPITLVIHGGAGTIKKENMTPERELAYREKLQQALNTGYAVLENGGTSLDAVTETIQILEESPLFNAGRGAVFTSDGKNELDASIMNGATGEAGAVAGVTTLKSPILAARTVMEKSPHVMMAREGAEAFAKEQGLEIVDPSYFYDENRHNQLQKLKENQEKDGTAYLDHHPDYKFGTVGCVALDAQGNIAAGTSTGGMTNKKWGRIGDSPVIGAGTYADNNTCGVSSTGHGEYFIRYVVAYDIAALMKYKGLSLEEAAKEVVMQKLVEKGGTGGVVALDRQGNVAMPFNTAGMFRGYIKEKDKPMVFIYKDEN
ncbi:Isoaspartyl aminopeptidase [Fulvivirga imtechensis AK7]|uniref:Isoaspartyl peptidase n=1 Tax=Fulvivirga imtechensis AK7 TaxID=1237149 RepID=L8JV87_9BACT|nr:isoaspartyl peptidase/L-asparaginase [Fulvivirga imtechensis]ELR72946.1 Isoaspartyl aminopeptidase [Fulvivirga imtechensis AK7]